MTVFPTSKNFVPEDKLVCRLLRNTSCKPEFVPVKMHTVDQVLSPAVSPVDFVNVNVKFTPLWLRVYVVSTCLCSVYVVSFLSSACLRLKSTNNFHPKHSTPSKCLRRSLTHQSNISHL